MHDPRIVLALELTLLIIKILLSIAQHDENISKFQKMSGFPLRDTLKALARNVTPPRSSIARPGRRYISGLIYLAITLVLAFGLLGIRSCMGGP